MNAIFRWRTAGCIALCAAASLIPASVAQSSAPLNLFNGTSLLGWTSHGNWAPVGGTITSNGIGVRSISTAVPFGDFNLQFEYSESSPVGAGLRLWTTKEGTGGFSVDLDISGTKNGVGGIQGQGRSSLTTVSAGWHKVQVDASHGSIQVKIDGQNAGTAANVGSRGGYLGFSATMTGQLQVRSIRLSPISLKNLFDGTDLSGWKNVARAPESKGGVGHSAEKVFSFGKGGGSSKPHSANWIAKGGVIHGEDGPGGLENDMPLDDGILQVSAAFNGDLKPDHLVGIAIRNTAGQLGGGYELGLGSYAGSIAELARYPLGHPGAMIDETVVFGGRTIAIWVAGNLVTVYTDGRPESGNAAQGARTQAGVLTLLLPDTDKAQLNIAHLSAVALPKPYGAVGTPVVASVPTPAATESTANAAAGGGGSAAAAANETAKVLLDQQKTTAQKDADAQATKQQVASLMGQALSSNDAQQQQNLYGQVIQLDPSNPNAMQGYKEAQAKLLQQQSVDAQANTKQHDAESREQQTNNALVTAQSAFLAGHLSEASRGLSVAERLSPDNPLVRELRNRINVAQSVRSRFLIIGSGVGLLALLSGFLLWFRRRRQKKSPALEVINGLDEGKIYPIDKDQTRVGAVLQDGGQKNDIVIRDVDHAISRFHCEIVRQNGQLYLQDLNSSNGTRLNGTRLKPGVPELLRKGARIKLAEVVELRFGYAREKKSS